jgi:inward rectifier potassium channel
MIRLGNERTSQIVDAQVSVNLLRNETTREGRFMRRFHDLKLVRARTPVFALSFTAVHVIDAASPLHGMTAEGLAQAEVELLVTVIGIDETSGQTVHARTSYTADEIRIGHRYADVFGQTADGRRAIDYARFHDTVEE